VYAYVGNGGRYQATWAGNSCVVNVDINNPRFFVRQLFKDFYGREPNGATPFGGARDFGAGPWQTAIDAIVAGAKTREQTGVDFMQSAEFVAAHPALNTAGIGTAAYNSEFVRQAYLVFLRREPDGPGFNFWLSGLNSNGNYPWIVDAFIRSVEYQQRANCGFASYHCG
jgi:hypothetical protein